MGDSVKLKHILQSLLFEVLVTAVTTPNVSRRGDYLKLTSVRNLSTNQMFKFSYIAMILFCKTETKLVTTVTAVVRYVAFILHYRTYNICI